MNLTDTRQHNCNVLKAVYSLPGVDKIILTLVYALTGVTIIVTNVMVIYGLVKTKQIKNRSNKLFIILSISDIVIGCLTVPAQIAKLISLNCVLVPALQLFSMFPALFSYSLTVLIAIDRYILVKHTSVYQKHITKNKMNIVVLFIFLSNVAASLWYGFGVELTPNVFLGDKTYILLCIYEVLTAILTSVLYIKLLFFVKKKAKTIEIARHSNSNKSKRSDSRVTKTIAYIFVSLICCYFTHAFALLYVIANVDEHFNKIVLRNILAWSFLAVTSNSAINAIIFLIRNQKIKEHYEVIFRTVQSRRQINVQEANM